MKLFSSMMKCGSVLFFLLFFVGTVAADGPPSRKIKQHNWENSMGPGGWSTQQGGGGGQMCVNLLSDYILVIKLYININDTSLLTNMHPMQLKYSTSINGIPLGGGYTPIANKYHFEPIYDNNGVITYYKATYAQSYDLSAYCVIHGLPNPDWEHDFTVNYQLVYQSLGLQDIPYPVGLYPAAWPPTEYDIPSQLYDLPVSDTKNVCCPTPPRLKSFDDGLLMATEGTESLDSHQLMDEDANDSSILAFKGKDVLVTPNPFNEDLKVQFIVDQTGRTTLELLDVQGRIVNRIVYDATSLGLQAVQLNSAGLTPGIYYLRISDDARTHLVKLMKARN